MLRVNVYVASIIYELFLRVQKSEKKKDLSRTTTDKKKEMKATKQSPRRRSTRGKKRKAEESFQLSHFMDEKVSIILRTLFSLCFGLCVYELY